MRERFDDGPDVIHVAGNHEAWNGDVHRTVEKSREAAIGSRVRVLSDDSVLLGHVTFAGVRCGLTTLYSATVAMTFSVR